MEAQSTELIDTPMIFEPAATRKVGQVPDPKKNYSKTKGFPCGPTRGPLSTKYKWTKPTGKTNSSSSLLNRKTTEAVRPNKKKVTRPPTAKRATGKEKVSDQATVSFNPAGFYEVEVQYDHIAKLASACGFKNSDIEEVIAKDNEERKIQATSLVAPENTNEEVDLDLGRFEPDPEDELTSDEEE